MLDVTRRTIVIVGGGAVAARKTKGLFAAGAARVRCISPAFHSDIPEAVERVTAEYVPAHLDGAGLVYAATNSKAVNDAVVGDATARNILVTRVDMDDEHAGDFTTPAVHRDGPISLAVSAGSPALAAAIRDELVAELDGGWVQLAEAHARLRPILLKSSLSPAARREVFHKLSTRTAMDINAAGGIAALVQWIQADHPEIDLAHQ